MDPAQRAAAHAFAAEARAFVAFITTDAGALALDARTELLAARR
jgi:hypothetical protein